MNFNYPTPETVNELAEKSIDFHCHGVGRFDFTEIPELELQEIEDILAFKKHKAVLTLYLPKSNFENFLYLMDCFHAGKKAGKYQHIVGFSLEGPLLSSHGGTPESGLWTPTKQNWREIAACGQKGLMYVVISPDAQFEQTKSTDLHKPPHSITWVTETLLDGAVLPAPGHFTKTDPIGSAKSLQAMFDVVAAWGQGATITDHLYNDMPLNFAKHAWRTREEKVRRDEEIKSLNIDAWNLHTLEEDLGPVPATMIRNTLKGLVKLCQNFDGEHVDLAIVRKTVELVGAENMLMMTDSIESRRLAGRMLTMKEGSTLLYQSEGIVAAGSQNVLQQINNMFAIDLSLEQIKLITHIIPSKIIAQHEKNIYIESEPESDCV